MNQRPSFSSCNNKNSIVTNYTHLQHSTDTFIPIKPNMKQLTITITILSLILMSSISVQACTSYQDCASQCPTGLPACIGGKCACVGSEEKQAAAAAKEPLREIVKPCVSSCDCEINCRIGSKICHKNVCGCLQHPYYAEPLCSGN